MKPETQILLATYNGEEFLQQQLDSILNQTYTDWEILVRDDNSTDGTKEILKAFQDAHPDKMTIIEDQDGGLGACNNFLRLMELSTANIVCFSDQDDNWHPDKMKESIEYLKDMNEEYGPETPALVHHDMTMMDDNGEEIAPSFDLRNKMGKDDSSLNHLLVQNTVHGFCATTNRALIDKCLPPPERMEMHDAHLALTASTFGNIRYIPEQFADYRIHSKNVSGGTSAFNLGTKDFTLRKLFNGRSFQRIKSMLETAHRKLDEKCKNTEAFLERYGDEIPPEKRETLEDFSRLADVGSIERKSMIMYHGFFPKSFTKSAAFLALG